MRPLQRRYGTARKKPEVTIHQCPGCGDPVAVKRVSSDKPSTSEDEERMCQGCQRAARTAAKKRAQEKVAARVAARPKTVAVHDALGFYLGERPEDMTDAAWIAAKYGPKT